MLDSSAIIRAKSKDVIAVARQWEFFEGLKMMVQARQIYFPGAVRKELAEVDHPDTPGAWALNAYEHMDRSHEPRSDALEEVMRSAGAIVDPDAEKEEADPYVLAQAIELRRRGWTNVMVVTNERLDKKPLISMPTACERLGLASCSLEEFLTEIGFDPKDGWLRPPDLR